MPPAKKITANNPRRTNGEKTQAGKKLDLKDNLKL
jgi:hypothetical protein